MVEETYDERIKSLIDSFMEKAEELGVDVVAAIHHVDPLSGTYSVIIDYRGNNLTCRALCDESKKFLEMDHEARIREVE